MNETETGYRPEAGDRVRVTRYVRVHATGEHQDVTVQAGVLTEAEAEHGAWFITLDTCPDRIFTGDQFLGQGNGGAATLVTEVEPMSEDESDREPRFRQQMAPDYAIGLDAGDCVVIWVTDPWTGAVERTLTITHVDEHKDALDQARRAQEATAQSAGWRRTTGPAERRAVDQAAVRPGDTITYRPPSGRGESTARVEYVTRLAVHVVTPRLSHIPVHWNRVTGHTPQEARDAGR